MNSLHNYEKQNISVVKDKGRKTGGINLNGNLQCTRSVGWKTVTTLDRVMTDF